MPIFEYHCSSCGNEFEKLVRSGDTAECPACHGQKLDKKISVFATTSSQPSAPACLPEACGSCGNPGGPGACMLN
jgi:putative FmdB family regulatory protein